MAGDLNLKKSWNPALVKNQKKIWQDEQNKLQEIKQIKQLQQEYHQESEYKNLLTLQYGEGFDVHDLNNKEKLKLNKLNWMYDDMPKKDEEVVADNGFVESNEEFLDGKNEVEHLLSGNKSFTSQRKGDGKSAQFANHTLNNILSTGKGTSSPASNGAEDPLLKIKQERQRQQLQSSSSSHHHRSRQSSNSAIRRKDDHKVHKESHRHHSSSRSHKPSSSHRTSSKHHHHGNHSDSKSSRSSTDNTSTKSIPNY